MFLLKFLAHLLLFFFGTNKYIDFQHILCEYGLSPTAWSVYGGADNFNIAFPDIAAMYSGSFICMKDNDTITLESDVPYARYYSVQVYDSTKASLGSLNDHEINVHDGKFAINITKVGTKRNLTNANENILKIGASENILKISTPDKFLILIYRVYDVPNATELKTQYGVSSNGRNEIFGWIKPPKLYKHGKIIVHSDTYTKITYPRIYRNIDPIKPTIYNAKNNFFKPYSSNYFSNNDANYLISPISLATSNTSNTSNTNAINNKTIGAIIKGFLPLTDYKRTNYFKNQQNSTCVNFNMWNMSNILNHPHYHEVRYVSFNMGILSKPYPTIAGPMLQTYCGTNVNPQDISSTGKPGITDSNIINKYNNSKEWNNMGRPFTIFVGLNLDHIIKLGGNPNTDLYMIYPTHYDTKKPFTYPVIVFRHLMSQEKFMSNPIFKNGIGSINKLFATSEECQSIMQKYYPTIEFFYK